MTTEMNKPNETYAFSADINQLLSLIINTFYSNKDVFLRELISNSSDALDKIRYKSLTDPAELNTEKNLQIKISFNKEARQLIIQDTGIGMTKQELITNLGTIAKSGTKTFIESMTNVNNDISMIGQFGVGFYSAYLVANKVDVISKNNNDVCYIWESTAGGSFNISEYEDATITRGTKMILHLKDDMDKYLEENTIKELIKKHNQFISFPIYLECQKSKEVEVEAEVEEQEQKNKEEVEKTDDDTKVEDVEENEEDKKEQTKKTKTEIYFEYDHLNQERPIWLRKPEEVTQEEYVSFYKNISNDYDEHMDVSHFSVEGNIEFKGLLYIPKRAPFDIFDNAKKPNNIKLYVRKVFISDDSSELVPDYMKFITGVVDSDDLPLNISRETLQQNKIMKIFKKNIVKKCIDLIGKISEDEEKYKTFYEQFSKNIKLGVHEDSANRPKLASFLRFETTKSQGKMISLDQYIENMKEGQKGIYFITGESKKSIINSPFLEKLASKDMEVIFMVDPLDEYITQQLKDYGEKKLLCITKENLELGEQDNKDEFENMKKEYEGVCKLFKEVLEGNVEKVILSNRLNKSPCVLVTNEYGMTANMQRIMKAQALRGNDMGMNMNKNIMELNPYNKTIQTIKAKMSNEDEVKTVRDLIHMLYDITLLSSGMSLEDPVSFSNRMVKLINIGLGVDNDEEDVVVQSEEQAETSNQPEEESTMEEVD
jgi:molecular chaperone HtpG